MYLRYTLTHLSAFEENFEEKFYPLLTTLKNAAHQVLLSLTLLDVFSGDLHVANYYG